MPAHSKLTPELQATIVAALEKGNYRSTAAAAAGIHRNTLINWERWGEEGKEPFAAFMSAMQAAEARAEMTLLEDIRTARPAITGGQGADVWAAKAWILARRFSSRWSERVKQTVQENVEALTNRLKSKPELHAEVVRVLDVDQEPAPVGTDPAKH